MTPKTTNTTAWLISFASLWSLRFAKQLYPRDNLVRIAAGLSDMLRTRVLIILNCYAGVITLF